MIWQIDSGKEALKFIFKNKISDTDIENNFIKVIQRLSGQNINLQIKTIYILKLGIWISNVGNDINMVRLF